MSTSGTVVRTEAPATAPAPWVHEESGTRRKLARLTEALRGAFERFVLCRGSKVAYLRRLGTRVGSEVALLNAVRDFGTEPWLIEIGSRVNVAAGVVFVNHDGPSRVFRREIEGSSAYGNRFGPIRILDNCVIGTGTVLLPGITIGPDSIVGANSVVTKDVPARTVAGGVPARVLCSLEDYMAKYRAAMIPGLASDRRVLRRQLTRHFWGEER
jgi:acetyltransferase-like isoleucine patch superfamily enzyme